MRKPIIFLSNFHPFISRNIFDSGAIDLIACEAEHVYVFVLKYKETYLREKYEKGNITIIGIDLETEINTRGETQLRRIAELLLNTNTKKLHQRIYHDRDGSVLKYICARGTMSLAQRFRFIRTFFRRHVLKRIPGTPFDAYYKKYMPTLTVVTDPFSPYDLLLMKASRKAKVPLRASLRSWDNFTTKEYLQVLPDIVLVQNEDMVSEGNELHDIPKASFKLVGVPQFEYYTQYIPISRETFCDDMHLDPNKKIILFSPAGDKFSSTDWQICELLKKAVKSNQFVMPVQFLVRLHPMNPTDLSKFSGSSNFVIDDPRVTFKGRGKKEAEMGLMEVNHLADSLQHSSVVINVVSSLLIDAAVLNKPVVTVSFDGWETDVPLTRSVLAEQSNEWLQVLLDKEISPRAHSIDELVSYINTYLSNPTKDQEKRAQFVNEHCWKLDGDAPKRIAQYVLDGV